MYELINNKYIKVKEYKGQRVVTFKDIDLVHERPNGTARKRFNDNKEHFIEGVDYFVINQPSEIRTLGITRPQGGTPEEIVLVTASGYLMIVKSFTDDLAWSVQRMLVNSYFCLQQKQSTEKYSGISKIDIIEGIKFFCEQHTEHYLYLNQKFDRILKENHRLKEEISELRKEIKKIKR